MHEDDSRAPRSEGPPVAIVTGGSSGLGLEIARELGRRGYALLLVARDEERLDRCAREISREAGTRVEWIAADLAGAGGTDEVWAVVEEHGIEAEVLVNSAGFGDFGEFAEADPKRVLAMVDVNARALTDLTRRVLPGMIARGRGRVLNLSSTAAYVPGPLMAVYYATKAYVLSLSEAVAQELDGTGVTVTALAPGPVETRFQERAEMQSSGLLRLGLMAPDRVAREGVEAMMKGRRAWTPGFGQRLMMAGTRLVPRGTLAKVVEWIQAPRRGRER